MRFLPHRVLLALLALIGAADGAQVVIDRVLAVVGGSVITASDERAVVELGLLSSGTGGDPRATVLDRLVERELMRLEIVRFSALEPTAAEVEARLREIASRYASGEEYRAVLARLGMTDARVRAFVRDDLVIADYLRQRFAAAAQPIDEEVRQYYRANLDRFQTAEGVRPYEEVEPEVRRLVTEARRAALVRGWVDDLRRRIEVRRVEGPGRDGLSPPDH